MANRVKLRGLNGGQSFFGEIVAVQIHASFSPQKRKPEPISRRNRTPERGEKFPSHRVNSRRYSGRTSGGSKSFTGLATSRASSNMPWHPVIAATRRRLEAKDQGSYRAS